jgi:hypothetical protein
MKRHVGLLKRLTLVTFALTTSIFLVGCVGQRTASPEWVRPIYFQSQTIEWLAERQPEWPPTMAEDLAEIDKHNQRLKAVKGD